MLSMGRRDPTWGSKQPVSPTKGKKTRNPTRRSKKSTHTKRGRKRKRSRRELPQIPPGGRARARERRLQAPGKENTSARKSPGKCLPRNLPLLLGRRVTFAMQAAPAPAALRTLNPRGKRRNGLQGRERSATTPHPRGRVRCRRRGARGRTGRWRGMRNLRTALMRTEGSGCSSEQEGSTGAGLCHSALLQHWFTHMLPAHREQRARAASGSPGSTAGQHPPGPQVGSSCQLGCDQVGFSLKLCLNRLLFWLTKTTASRREDRLINQAVMEEMSP